MVYLVYSVYLDDRLLGNHQYIVLQRHARSSLVHRPKERLINSCLHEELCSWVDQPGPFGGNPLVRECLFWGVARCQAARAPVRPRPLGCR